MSKLAMRPLGDLIELKYGKALAASDRKPGPVPVFGSNGEVGYHRESITSGPTIVVGRKGSIGKINFSRVDSWPIDTTYYIDHSGTSAHLRWLYHLLNQLDLARLNKAVAIPGLNRDDVYRIRVYLPTLEEQRRIAAILDQADALRTKRRQALAKLDTLTQSLFLEMFGDPRCNPLCVRAERLGKLLALKSGNFLPANQMTEGGKYPVYGGNGVNGYHDQYMFEKPMIVIGRVGAYCGAVHLTSPYAWVTDNALFVSTSPSFLTQRYLSEALRLADLNQYSSQSGQPLISLARISDVRLLVPPMETQAKYVELVGTIDSLREQIIEGQQRSDQLFASIQDDVFNGGL